MLYYFMCYRHKLFWFYASNLLGNLKEILLNYYKSRMQIIFLEIGKSCGRQSKAFDRSVSNAPNNIP